MPEHKIHKMMKRILLTTTHLILALTLCHAQTFDWAAQFSGNNYGQGIDIVTDGDGNIISTGIFNGTIDIDPGADVTSFMSTSEEIYVTKQNAIGELIWAIQLGSLGDDVAWGITTDNSNNIYLTGHFQGTVDFDPSAADSMNIEITETKPDDGTHFDFYVQDNDYEFVVVKPNRYTVQMGDYEQKINLREKPKNHENDFNAAWLVLCAETDLVLVEVTDICKENVTAEELAQINWKDKVIDRFNGDELIEPNLQSERGGEIQVVEPGYYIPQKHGSREKVYALIPIERALEVTEEFLLKKITNVTEL